MSMGFIGMLKAAIREAREEQQKQKAMEALVGENLNYTLLERICRGVPPGVHIRLTLKSGEPLEVWNEPPFEGMLKKEIDRRNRQAIKEAQG